jgi:hypothetical protein
LSQDKSLTRTELVIATKKHKFCRDVTCEWGEKGMATSGSTVVKGQAQFGRELVASVRSVGGRRARDLAESGFKLEGRGRAEEEWEEEQAANCGSEEPERERDKLRSSECQQAVEQQVDEDDEGSALSDCDEWS